MVDNAPTVEKTKPDKHPLFNFLIQFILCAIIFFSIGYSFGHKRLEIERKSTIPIINVTNKLPPREENIDFSLFWSVLESLPAKYVDKSAINAQKLLYGAISGMVRSLGDPYTAFLDPKQNQAINDELSGSYSGVGIQLGFNKDKRLAVIAPLRGTPAEREGVLPLDLILSIDDKETFDMTLPEAVELIRGAAGSKVKLLLQRGDDKPFEKTIERAQINVKSVEVEFKDSKKGEIAVLKVSRFGEKTDAEWDDAIYQVLQKNPKGVILDLRNNPGGLLSSSIHMGSEFVKGTIVKQEYSDGTTKSLSSDHDPKLAKIPLTVLVNGGSASASEIVAGAIQDNRRGKVIGEKTFGKGTVQDVVELSGGSSLHVTVARWLTPKSNSIHGVGITPDIIIEMSPTDREQKKDPQMDKALDSF